MGGQSDYRPPRTSTMLHVPVAQVGRDQNPRVTDSAPYQSVSETEMTRNSKYLREPVSFVVPGTETGFRKRPMDLVYFSGNDKSWEAFLNQFMMISGHNQWTEREACEQLQRAMTGNAANFLFENITPASKRDFVGLVDILAGRFGSEDNYALNAKKLRSRRKQKGESFKDYAQDLTLYAKRMFGYHADTELIEREGVSANSLEQLITSCIHMTSSVDMDDMDVGVPKGRVNAIGSQEQNSQNFQNNKSNWNNQNDNRNFQNNRSNWNNQNDSQNSQNNRGSWNNQNGRYKNKKRPFKCYGCGEEGHFLKNCTQARKWKCDVCTGVGHRANKCPSRETVGTSTTVETEQQGNENRAQ
jgi:hypothetical protein